MFKLLDELAQPVDFVEHFHCGKDVITVVASGGRIFQYVNDIKLGWYKIPNDFIQLARNFNEIGKDLMLLENAVSNFQESGISNVVFAGKFVVGILLRNTLVFFENSFKDHLLENKLGNVQNRIAKSFNLSIMQDESSYVVHIALLSLLDGANVHLISEKLYLALFGLEALKCSYQVLVLFLNSGQMWYLFLKEWSAPKYIYSFDDECSEVFVDKADSKLTISTKTHCLYVFTPDNDTYKVTKLWNNFTTEFYPNLCSFAIKNNQVCSPSLCVKNTSVLYRKSMQCLKQNNEEQLNQLRSVLKDCELQKQALSELIQERLKALTSIQTLADFSSTESKSTNFVFTPEALEVHWLSNVLSFRPFSVILSSNSISETFYSNQNRIIIPVKTALKFNEILCLFFEKDLWFLCGCIRYNIFNFLKSDTVRLKSGHHFKFQCELKYKINAENTKHLLKTLMPDGTNVNKSEFVVEVMNTLIHTSCTLSTTESSIHVRCDNNCILHQFCDCLTEQFKIAN